MIFKVLGGYTSSLEMVKIGAYLLTVGKGRGRKGFYGKYKSVSLGKTKGDKLW